jgi:anti-sigma regulatory factor (Ser/Thr protein kinase)
MASTSEVRQHPRSRTVLRAEARSAGAGRRFVMSTLEEWGLHELLNVVRLLTSELVTDAIRAAEADLELAVKLENGRVRVQVWAPGEAKAPAMSPDAGDDADSARGMLIIEDIADAWGGHHGTAGRTTWFEVVVPHQPA